MTATNNSNMGWSTPPESVMTTYTNRCKVFAASTKEFNTFKQDKDYQLILETSDKSVAHVFYREIFTNPIYRSWFLDAGPDIYNNDNVGQPTIHDFEEVSTSMGTLIYSWKSMLIKNFLNGVPQKRIVEIGGGYGGMCVTMHTLVGFDEYVIVDLPDVVALCKKYLEHFPDIYDKVKFVSCDDLTTITDIDFLIADSSLAECDEETQLSYYNKLVQHSTRGYIIYNTLHLEQQRNAFRLFSERLNSSHTSTQRKLHGSDVLEIFYT